MSAARPESLRGPIDRLSDAAAALGGWMMVLASAFIAFEILSRFFFSKATVWVYDITTYSVVWFAFITAGAALKERRHLNVDLYIHKCSPQVRAALDVLALALVIVLSMLLTFFAARMMVDAFARGELEPTIIRTPSYLIVAGMVFGLALLLLQATWDFARALRAWRAEARTSRGNAPSALLLRSPSASLSAFVVLLAAAIVLVVQDFPVAGLFLMLATMLTFGVPVFASLGLTGVAGILSVFGMAGLPQIAQIAYKSVDSNTLLAVPLYVLAGQILQAGRIGPELFGFASAWIGHWRGGYGVATVLACGVFAAISGSSVATAAAIGIIAIPEMLKAGYRPRFAYGLVAAGGTLGILIPPSLPMILYSSMTDVSTGALFMGGVIPGLVVMTIFCVYVVFACGDIRSPRASWRERLGATRLGIWGLLAPIIILVGIYTGAFTPTEAAAVAVLYGLVVALVRGTLRPREVQKVMSEGTLTSSMVLMIIVGAMLLGTEVTVLQIPPALSDLVKKLALSPWTVMAILIGIYLVLGMFLEVVSILLITVPIVFPLVISLGFDGLWFGIVLVILMEFALITPPVGLNLFTIQGITRARLAEIVAGVIPFIFLLAAGLGLVLAFPQLSAWLPGRMGLGGS